MSLSEGRALREGLRELFRLREGERDKRHVRGKIRRRATLCDNTEGPSVDFSQLLPSQPLSPAELSQVERITTNCLEEELLGNLSRDLEQLDDIDFPRLEEEQIICDVPLTFRRDLFDKIYIL